MINSADPTERGAARLRNALLFLGEPESAAVLEILGALDAAQAALREPAGADPCPHAAGALISVMDTVAREYRRLGS